MPVCVFVLPLTWVCKCVCVCKVALCADVQPSAPAVEIGLRPIATKIGGKFE